MSSYRNRSIYIFGFDVYILIDRVEPNDPLLIKFSRERRAVAKTYACPLKLKSNVIYFTRYLLAFIN